VNRVEAALGGYHFKIDGSNNYVLDKQSGFRQAGPRQISEAPNAIALGEQSMLVHYQCRWCALSVTKREIKSKEGVLP
jgi:hypothetical protein